MSDRILPQSQKTPINDGQQSMELCSRFVLVLCVWITLVMSVKQLPISISDDSNNDLKDSTFRMPSIMELSTRPWLYYLSQKYGKSITTLSEIPPQEFQQYADSGFDYIWMMGVWSLGQYGLNHDQTDPSLLQSYSQTLPGYTQSDIIGSPYAVVNYTCNSQLGSDDDILAMKKTLNDMGLKLILDFVPNHSAVDCPYTSSNINYYVRAPNGVTNSNKYLSNGIAYGSACSGCGSWPDTAQFNIWDSGLQQARIQDLLHVASLSDGIRCDMAYLLLNDMFQQTWSTELTAWGYKRPSSEWWTTAIQTVKAKYPDVIFLAEVYSPWGTNLQQCGFDFTYDKDLYDRLGNGDLNNIRAWLTQNSVQYLQHCAHFTANHDEQRGAAFFGSWWRSDAAAILTYTVPGMKFFWMWEENGFAAKLDVHLRRETTEQVNTNVVSFYNTLWSIVNTDVFKLGTWTYIPVTGSNDSWRLIAYSWQYNNQKRLVVVNYSDQQGSGNVIVSNAQSVNGNDTIPVTDLLSGQTYYRSASQMRSQGLFVVVNSWYGQIFQYD